MIASSLTPSFLIFSARPSSETREVFAKRSFASFLRAVLRNSHCLVAIGDLYEVIAGLRQSFQSEDFHRSGRSSLVERIAPLVEHGAYASEHVANDEVFASLQRAVLHEHRCYWSAAAIEFRFQHYARSSSFRIRFQVLQIRNQADHFHQQVEIGLLLRRNFNEYCLTAPVFRHQAAIRELLLHAFRQRFRLIDLVHRHDDRHIRRARVIDRFQCLRHYAVVSRDYQYHDVRDLRAARTHARERFVTRRIEEHDLPSVGRRILIA